MSDVEGLLEQVRALLGVEVLGVRRHRRASPSVCAGGATCGLGRPAGSRCFAPCANARPVEPSGWFVTLPGSARLWPGKGPFSTFVESRELRSPRRLTGWAVMYGRDRSLPALSREDGRRVVRLLHRVADAEELAALAAGRVE